MSRRARRQEVEGLRLKAEAARAQANARRELAWDFSGLDMEELHFLLSINRKLKAGLEPTAAEREACIVIGQRAGAPEGWFKD